MDLLKLIRENSEALKGALPFGPALRQRCVMLRELKIYLVKVTSYSLGQVGSQHPNSDLRLVRDQTYRQSHQSRSALLHQSMPIG